MKNILLISLSFVLCICISCNQDKQDATKRNNLIVKDQIKFYQLHDSLFYLFSEDAPGQQCLSIYDSLSWFLKDTKMKYDTIQPFEEDTTLDGEWMRFLNAYQDLILNEYKEILHIVVKPRYLIESADLNTLDSLYQVIDFRQDKIDQAFTSAQEEFCSRNGVQFEE